MNLVLRALIIFLFNRRLFSQKKNSQFLGYLPDMYLAQSWKISREIQGFQM